jgi:hypothetical protein
MKKVSLVLILITITLVNSYAQIDKGQKMLGGNMAYKNVSLTRDTEPESSIKGFQATITPQFGIGMGNNWIIGAMAGFGYAEQKDKYDNREDLTDARTYSIGVFARKFRPVSDVFGLFGEARAEYGFGKGESRNMYRKTEITSYAANLLPGLYFKPGKKLVIESTFGVLGYSHKKEDNNDLFVDSKTNEFNFSIVDGLSFGLKFIL